MAVLHLSLAFASTSPMEMRQLVRGYAKLDENLARRLLVLLVLVDGILVTAWFPSSRSKTA